MSDVDLFAAVEALEGQHQQRGLEQGEEEGRRRQHRDGYNKGWQQACHLLQELGTLRGVVAGLLNSGGGSDAQRPGTSGDSTLEHDENVGTGQQDENNLNYSGACGSLPNTQPIDPKIRSSLEKLLSQLENNELWFKLGASSDEKLAQHLSSLQTKARFTLRKLNIPMHVIDRTLEAEF